MLKEGSAKQKQILVTYAENLFYLQKKNQKVPYGFVLLENTLVRQEGDTGFVLMSTEERINLVRVGEGQVKF